MEVNLGAPTLPEPSPSSTEQTPHVHASQQPELLPRALRAVGACLLLIAASSFLFRTWGQEDDVTRYLMLLGQLVLLGGAGFFCALKVQEKRGARTFFSLVVAVVPVHFAVLGGVIYSQLAMDSPASDLPSYFIWKAQDALTAVLLVVGAQLALIPATFVAMLTLVRKHAWQLTLVFLAFNAVLLIPIREPNTIAWILAALVPLLLYAQTRLFPGSPSMSTPQGRLVRTMLAAPVVVLIGRTMFHYSVTASLIGVLALTVGLALVVYAQRLDGERRSMLLSLKQVGGLMIMVVGWTLIAGDNVLGRVMNGSGLASLDIPLIVLPWAVLFWLTAGFAILGAAWYRRAGAAIAVIVACVNILFFHETATSLLCLGVGIAVFAYGVRWKQRVMLVLGAAAAVVGLLGLSVLAIHVEALTHWVTLTVLGVALIFVASALDRNRQYLMRRVSGLRIRLREWSY